MSAEAGTFVASRCHAGLAASRAAPSVRPAGAVEGLGGSRRAAATRARATADMRRLGLAFALPPASLPEAELTDLRLAFVAPFFVAVDAFVAADGASFDGAIELKFRTGTPSGAARGGGGALRLCENGYMGAADIGRPDGTLELRLMSGSLCATKPCLY